MEISAAEGLRLTDQYSGLERGFINPRKKESNMCSAVNTRVSIGLEVLHLIEDPFAISNGGLAVAIFELPYVLEGMQLIFKLSCVV